MYQIIKLFTNKNHCYSKQVSMQGGTWYFFFALAGNKSLFLICIN